LITKYISISNDMVINLLNVALESINEYHLFVFEKALNFNYFDEPVIQDVEVQEQFVEAIKDRLNNKDKFYIIERFAGSKLEKVIEKGMARRESNNINEASCIQYFTERLKSFIILKNAQQIVAAVKNADSNMRLGLIDQKDLAAIESNIYSLHNDITFEIDFGEMELDDIEQRERDRNLVNQNKIIPTWSNRLNDILVGGAYPNKLYFVAAPPGFGKSLFLVNIGHHALKENKIVYHFTLEMTASEVMTRYDCLVAGRPLIDIINSPASVIDGYVKKFTEEHPKSHLLLKEFPPEILTKEMLALYIKRKIMSSGKKPDVIIVDYADLMKSSVKNTERRADLGLIYRQLKALAAEFTCPVWTASQINRAGYDRQESDISNLAESWEKAMIADLVLVARQTKEEFTANKLRLYIGKNRSGLARTEIPCKISYKHMKIEESDEVEFEDLSEVSFGGGEQKTSETDDIFA
jgi:replicative DNA helicase